MTVPTWVKPLIDFIAWIAKEVADLVDNPSEEKARKLRAEAMKRVELAASEVEKELAEINKAFPG